MLRRQPPDLSRLADSWAAGLQGSGFCWAKMAAIGRVAPRLVPSSLIIFAGDVDEARRADANADSRRRSGGSCRCQPGVAVVVVAAVSRLELTPLRSSRMPKFITPAMASEPYWAVAPSRSTWRFLTRDRGDRRDVRPLGAERQAGVAAGVDLDQRRAVQALAVDLDQHLVAGKAAQRWRANEARGVGDGVLPDEEGRNDVLDRVEQVGRRLGGQLGRADDVDRRRPSWSPFDRSGEYR